ncbi:glycine/D-amino acid oxidase-like deaminating enzyme [Saonia flava]|uniref:Glycine/D-amino acid oxidase-like deaminating enzyme n=1 Tax=Saonia flava TaxID=523696 RepID=A0A846QT90_9FLAO|nr:FAD-dependent oxidoreductase [Saonia flava]NJB71411.1 glycine/D-amino acid oxidase-like deaminating enzyme [Saonia flava]
MTFSYWEYKLWLSNIDFTIVGSGIVGLSCALSLKNKYPEAKILVLEKGILPQGASTKNAGFACFGSISEIVSDLQTHSEDEVLGLVKKRWDGIQLLRKTLGDENIDFQNHGGHELFMYYDEKLYQDCLAKLNEVNSLLKPIFGVKGFREHGNSFNFRKVKEQYITNSLESQIDTGKMMDSLINKVSNAGIHILNSITVKEYVENPDNVLVKTNLFDFKTNKLLIATNGFAPQLTTEEVKPARAQVLITKPIKNLHVKGTFHLDQGYYYFRNIDNRILFGGGRNLDFKAEETSDFGETHLVQNTLKKMLHDIILPSTSFEVDYSWSGIMGVGKTKNPIVKQLSNHVYCGVRLGGMGIAIGSFVGKELADLTQN